MTISVMSLATLISHVESDGHINALRYEPDYIPRSDIIELVKTFNRCTEHTARVICQMSWGQFQFMGSTLYGLGYHDFIGVFLDSQSLQIKYFNQYVQSHAIDYDVDLMMTHEDLIRNFAKKYNGPGNIEAYVIRMKKVYEGLIK